MSQENLKDGIEHIDTKDLITTIPLLRIMNLIIDGYYQNFLMIIPGCYIV